ncbi:unnamed protein product, partial [Linum tenue]
SLSLPAAVCSPVHIQAVTDLAVNNFRKVISLLGKPNRIGHARFRRAPVSVIVPPTTEQGSGSVFGGSTFKVYQPTPIHRLPPLPTNHHHHQKAAEVAVAKERNELVPSSTINFSNSPSISAAATSFMSSLTGDTDSMQRSMSSSGFQFTQPSHGKPLLSSSSLKRKCSSMDDVRCGSSSGRCHCSKKRFALYAPNSNKS